MSLLKIFGLNMKIKMMKSKHKINSLYVNNQHILNEIQEETLRNGELHKQKFI